MALLLPNYTSIILPNINPLTIRILGFIRERPHGRREPFGFSERAPCRSRTCQIVVSAHAPFPLCTHSPDLPAPTLFRLSVFADTGDHCSQRSTIRLQWLLPQGDTQDNDCPYFHRPTTRRSQLKVANAAKDERKVWWSQRDLNPCLSLERAPS